MESINLAKLIVTVTKAKKTCFWERHINLPLFLTHIKKAHVDAKLGLNRKITTYHPITHAITLNF